MVYNSSLHPMSFAGGTWHATGCRVIRASPHPSARKPGLCAPVPFPHVCTMVSKILPPGVRGRRSIIKTDVANSITECLSIQQRMSNFVPIMGF